VIIDIETTGVNTFEDRIICIGVYIPDAGIIIIYDPDEETMLKTFINFLGKHKKLIGWKIKVFDVPFLKARMLIYNLSDGLNLMKFTEVIDMHEILRDYTVSGQPLHSSIVYKALGIHGEDYIHGGDVPHLYKVADIAPENIELIKDHCRYDIAKMAELYSHLKINGVV